MPTRPGGHCRLMSVQRRQCYVTVGSVNSGSGQRDRVGWPAIGICISATVWGAAVWWLAMGSAPRYSLRGETGNYPRLLLGLLLGAVAVGVAFGIRAHQQQGDTPARTIEILLAVVAGALVSLPGWVMSPWTTPRGDNDGLWGLWMLYLGVAVIGTSLIAVVTALVVAGLSRILRAVQ
jgi:hypothetical protein